jgi:hypothetical protein
VNLDFARWGPREAYEADSLCAVLERIHGHREEAQERWGHEVELSARLPYDRPPDEEERQPVFLQALGSWCSRGYPDRLMVELQHDLVLRNPPLGHYVQALRGSSTAFWLDMYWGSWFYGGGPLRDLAVARRLAGQGLDGGVFYYMRARPIEWEQINWQMRLVDAPDVLVDPHQSVDELRRISSREPEH